MNAFDLQIIDIKRDLQDMKLSGMDVDSYEKRLKNAIFNGTKESVESIINELSLLKDELRLRKLLDYAKSLTFLDDSSVFNSCATIIDDLNSINIKVKCNNEEIVKCIYKAIFMIIIKEVELDHSAVLIKVNSSKEAIYYINLCLIEEIQKINDSSKAPTGADKLNVLFNQSRNQKDQKISLDVLKQLIFVNNYGSNSKKYSDYIKEVQEKLNSLSKTMVLDKKDVDILYEYVQDATNKVHYVKKIESKLNKRVISLFLSTCLVGGIGYVIPKVIKDSFKTEMYKTTTSIYTSSLEDIQSIVDYQKKIDSKSKVLVIEDNFKKGSIFSYPKKVQKKYDLSDISLETWSDYLNLDVDFYSLKPYYTDSVTVEESDVEDKRTLTIIEQEDTFSYIDDNNNARRNIVIALYVLLGISLFLPCFPIGILKKIRKDLYDVKYYKYDYRDFRIKIDRVYKNYEKRIIESIELTNEFKRLVNEGMELYVSGDIFKEIDRQFSELESKRYKLRNEFDVPYMKV